MNHQPIAHPWDLTPAEARTVQESLVPSVVHHDALGPVRWIAGLDVHYPEKHLAHAAVVLFAYPDMVPTEVAVIEDAVHFPYVPGLLSFREAPALLKALDRLRTKPDLLLIDGQGLAHPRRFGVACHLGLLTDIPAIGCAKSRLIGGAAEPGRDRGDWTPLIEGGETVGAVVRTRAGVSPLYVSTGHRVSLATARAWVLACGRHYRLPEPCRMAHRAAGGGHVPIQAHPHDAACRGDACVAATGHGPARL